jgi:hypothetical protein
MNVAIHDELDVFDSEAKGPDIRDNLWDRLRKITIDQDMALRGCDEHGGQSVRAHVISVSENTEWLVRHIHCGAIITGTSGLNG